MQFLSLINQHFNFMKNFIFLLTVLLLLVLVGCSPNDEPKPTTAVKYYLYCNIDGEEVKFEYDKDTYREDYRNDVTGPPSFGYAAYSRYGLSLYMGQYKSLQFSTVLSTTNTPRTGTYAIYNTFYDKSRHEKYTILAPKVNGNIVITKINDSEAEGAFSFVLDADNTQNLNRVVVKDGRFKLKY